MFETDWRKGIKNMMNITEIIKISEECDRATGGPWVSYVEGRDHTSGCSFIQTAGEDIELTGATIADQDFIASCRQNVPLLIEEILRLKKLLKDHGIES